MRTADGETIKVGMEVYIKLGNPSEARRQPTQRLTVQRMTASRVRLIRNTGTGPMGSGRGCWRRPEQLWTTKENARDRAEIAT